MPRRAAIAVLLAAAASAGAGCGSSGGHDGARQADTPRAVIAHWAASLRGGDVARAADYFANGARVQNGGPVLELGSQTARQAFDASLPCGAQPTGYRDQRGFVVATFRLVHRRGAACGSGTGGVARCAIRVQRGHITDWIRLPDPQQEPGTPAPPPGGDGGGLGNGAPSV